MTDLVILGVGGYCVNLIEMVADINAVRGEEVFRVLGYLDDNPDRAGTEYFGYPVLGNIEAAAGFPEALFVNGIGSAQSSPQKPAIIARTGVPRERFATLIHPSAWVSPRAEIGAGTVVAQNCVVMAGTRVGDHVKMLPGATVSYLCRIGDHSTLATGSVTLADVDVGQCCYLGANSSVREFLHIGEYSILGMGAVVVCNVEPLSIMVGSPARLLRQVKIAQ